MVHEMWLAWLCVWPLGFAYLVSHVNQVIRLSLECKPPLTVCNPKKWLKPLHSIEKILCNGLWSRVIFVLAYIARMLFLFIRNALYVISKRLHICNSAICLLTAKLLKNVFRYVWTFTNSQVMRAIFRLCNKLNMLFIERIFTGYILISP